MATAGTTNLTAQGALNALMGTHNLVADANPPLVVIGGKYVATPTAVSPSANVGLWLNAYGFVALERQNVLLFSTSTASAGTSTGTAYTGVGAFRDIDVLIDVTGTGGTASTLNTYIDSRLDGTTWINLAHGTLQTTASVQIIHLSKRDSPGVLMVTADAGAGTSRAVGWGDDIRVRYDVSGTTANFTFRVFICGVG